MTLGLHHQDMKECLPKFIEENLDYYREEREGCCTFLSKRHPETQQLVLNRTGVEVKGLCDGTHTVEDICTILKERYSKIPAQVLEKDVTHIIRALWRLGLIEWIGFNPFSKMYQQHLDSHSEAYVASEEDVEIILTFLQHFGIPKRYSPWDCIKPFYVNPVFPPDGYAETVIRQKIFFNTEGFFLSCDDNTLDGLISFTFPNVWLPDRTTMIGLMLHGDTETSRVHLSKLLDFAVSTLRDVLPPQIRCTKVKCVQLRERGRITNDPITKFLSARGFAKEAECKDELGWGKDLQIFRRWIPT